MVDCVMRKLALLIVLAALAVGLYFLLSNNKSHKHLSKEKAFVSVAKTIQQDTVVYTTVVGNVTTHNTVAVKSLVDGQIINKNFNEGDFVKEGQTLFLVDPRPFKVALDQATATLKRDQALLLQAQKNYTRNSQLVKFGYISKQDFDNLVASRDSLQATVQADKAAVDNAALQLSYCTIKAPISGRAGGILINVGNIVKTGDSSSLVVINQISPIDIKFSIAEKYLPQIQSLLKQGTVEVKVQLQNSNTTKQGSLTFIDNTIDSTTGMIQLKAAFPNEDNFLWPGQFVNITIPLEKIPQAVLVPTRAIQIGQNGSYVFVVTTNNTVEQRPVVTGSNVDNNTIVLQGLTANEVVVTEGQLNLNPGSQVQYNKNDLSS